MTLHRYTIEGHNKSFRLVEDKQGAWMQAAEVLAQRCDTCKHWHGQQKDAAGREECTEPTISPHQMDEFMTLPDFGCVKWEAE